MSSSHLKILLANGESKSTLKNCDIEILPDGLDLERFERGQEFFKRNLSACLFTMLCSLVTGLSVINLLEPLVFTKRSDTPKKSLKRYLTTMVNVVQWHYGNVWDINSKARKSLQKVCCLHNNTRKDMVEKYGSDKMHVSQYDMSLVQAGFMGGIVMYPRQFGIRANVDDLNDYVYFWRWIGFLLGIEDKNNICINSLEEAIEISHEIENVVVYPALRNPPSDFYHMATAFTDGTNLLYRFKLFTPESIICFLLDIAKKKRISHSFLDNLRIMFLKFTVFLLYYCNGFRDLLNRAVLNLCKHVEKSQRKES